MVKHRLFLLILLPVGFLEAEIIITSSTVNLSAANAQLIAKLDNTLNDVFYGIASLAGPGIINSAAFSSTIGIQRQQANLPRLQVEPSLGVIFPGKAKGDERLGTLPLYAANLIAGFRFDETTALHVRGFYLPELTFTANKTQWSIQPYNFGITLNRKIKNVGQEWYNPAIISPLDFAYMHGSFSATFSGTVNEFSFDPTGDGSQGQAKANFGYSNDFRLRWNVYSLTSGLILVKPFLWVFTARMGLLASLHLGNSTFNNTAKGTMLVTASAAIAGNEFKVNDTASVEIRNAASFRPIFVSNQITFGLEINLFGATLNLDVAQNIQFNATAIVLQLGCWF